ncbi:DUF1127 domain-containing protein [Phaeobacter sp. J2-8]|uniref:DUF1127 domain-containing protein n=1 Tax=Phaeobacter sp. J2-8 TaxID=2931394 RepID=UPI001FD1DB9B|nr:DUF1127 domain-containing protein [Phaeobacter sp. J2-8]MCJ7871646.1 DUF1127 domain-containing protein [Phaeobacter sp. J2-8]
MAHALSNTSIGFGPNSSVSKLVTAFKTARARRAIFAQTYSELASLNDRELADIGVARSNIRAIAKKHAESAL